MGDNVEIDSSDFKNLNKVISLLGSCIDQGGHGAEHVLAVSIQQSNFNDNLSNTIKKGNGELKSSIDENTKEGTKDRKNTEKLLREGSNQQTYILKGLIKQQEEADKHIGSLFTKIYTKFLQNAPILSSIASTIAGGIEELTKLQLSNVNDYRKLIYSGVVYDKDLDYIHEAAREIQISSNEYRDSLIKNSRYVNKLQSFTKNGIESYNKLLKTTKVNADNYGLSMNEATNALTDLIGSSYDRMNANINEMDMKLKPYLKNLKALSYWTGKSAEQAQQESKIRENDAAWNIWSRNNGEKERMFSNLLSSLNAPEEFKADIVRGMNTGSVTKMYAMNTELGIFGDRLMQLRQTMDSMSTEEFEKELNEINSLIDKDKLGEVLKIPTTVAASFGQDFQSFISFALRMRDLPDWKKAIEQVEKNEKNPLVSDANKAIRDVESAIEGIKGSLSFNADTMKTAVGDFSKEVSEFSKFVTKLTELFDSKNDNKLDTAKELATEHPILSTITAAGSIAGTLIGAWIGKKGIQEAGRLLTKKSSVGINVNDTTNTVEGQLKNSKSLMNTPQQQAYKNWLKENPKAKNMSKADRIKQFNKFKNAGKISKLGKIGAAGSALSIFDSAKSSYDILKNGSQVIDEKEYNLNKAWDNLLNGKINFDTLDLLNLNNYAAVYGGKIGDWIGDLFWGSKLSIEQKKQLEAEIKNQQKNIQASEMKTIQKEEENNNNLLLNIKNMYNITLDIYSILKVISDNFDKLNELSEKKLAVQKEGNGIKISNDLKTEANGQ